jgi:hypothetical protein
MVKVILRGGPHDGLTSSTGSPPPFYFSAPESPYAAFMDSAGAALDAIIPKYVVYTIGAGEGAADDPLEYYYDTDVATVARALPSSWQWREVKPKRFQGRRRPALEPPWLTSGGGYTLHVAALVGDGRVFSKLQVLDEPELEQAGFDLEAYIWEEFEHQVTYELTPACEVPGCTKKGLAVFTALQWGRLVGRALQTGDKVRLCPEHQHDLWRVHPGGDEHLPAWLEADAYRPYALSPGSVVTAMKDERGMVYGGAFPHVLSFRAD